MEEQSFGARKPIFTQGDEGRSLYVIVSGRVRVHSGDQELAQMDKGKAESAPLCFRLDVGMLFSSGSTGTLDFDE